MSIYQTYESEDPVAACIGGERDDYWEILILIDVGCETTYLLPKADLPTKFRKYGLPVWLTTGADGKVCIEHRKIEMTPELLKEQEEIDKIIEGFNE